MNYRYYVFIFLSSVICISTSTGQSSALASQLLLEEIDKAVSSAEKTQMDEQVQNNLLILHQTSGEEQPADENDNQAENEDTIKNDKPVEDKAVPERKITNIPQKKKIPEETIQKNEQNIVKPISAEEFPPEKKHEIHSSLLSKFFNHCKNFFLKLSSDKTISLKEVIISKWFKEKSGCEAISETEQIVKAKDFLPYYFLYPKLVENRFAKISFSNNTGDFHKFLPYCYTMKNYEVKKINAPKNIVTSKGTTDFRVLMNAPSPKIEVKGKSLVAKLVIDIRNNTLYKYDDDGFPLKAYLVATGARGSRTMAGLRVVTYKERFPYKSAVNRKRALDPYSYGPYILFLNAVNPRTGKQYVIDQLLHGNGNERSIGKKISHGCIRTNNKVMKNELSKEVNRGDYIVLINPD